MFPMPCPVCEQDEHVIKNGKDVCKSHKKHMWRFLRMDGIHLQLSLSDEMSASESVNSVKGMSLNGLSSLVFNS